MASRKAEKSRLRHFHFNDASGIIKAMEKQYVEKRDNAYWITGTRVSLDSVVYAFLEGLSAETIITDCFPVLTLEQVFGALAFYLGNRAEIDAYLHNGEVEFESLRQASRKADPQFYEKLIQARRLSQMSRQ